MTLTKYDLIFRDEIQRIKAGNPDISHREAFSAAAKNVRSNEILNLTLLGTFSHFRLFSIFTNLYNFKFLLGLIKKYTFLLHRCIKV